MTNAWIQTWDGKQFFPENPDPELIDPMTIAVVLSRMARFGCHAKVDYSVAQHSIGVWRLVKTPELKLPALLHDAHEAYSGFGDVASPMKKALEEYEDSLLDGPEMGDGLSFLKRIEKEIDEAVAERFDFDHHLFGAEEIHQADMQMLATEKEHIMSPEPAPWIDLPEPEDGLIMLPNSPDIFLMAMKHEGISL